MECISCSSFDPVLSHLYVSKAASFLDLPNKEKASALHGAAHAVGVCND